MLYIYPPRIFFENSMTSPRAPSSSEPLDPDGVTVRSGSIVDLADAGDGNARLLLAMHGAVRPVRVRREPFPNPEAALWRPKAW